jgi:hypothetical protein
MSQCEAHPAGGGEARKYIVAAFRVINSGPENKQNKSSRPRREKFKAFKAG